MAVIANDGAEINISTCAVVYSLKCCSSDGSTIETEYADVSINDSDSSAIFFSRPFLNYLYAMVPYIIKEEELVQVLQCMKDWFARG